jgi:peptide/nickel transport system ATP-binding protein
MSENLLDVVRLSVDYGGGRPALADVSLSVASGERVAVVGESGSGKSTLIRAVLGMLPGGTTTSGSIRFDGTELTTASERELTALRGASLALIPQDPRSSLDPLLRVGPQVAEGPLQHRVTTRRDSRALVQRLLSRAGLPRPEETARRYPHQLSGGLRQRVLIANGIASDPRLLLADEPTSALDVTVQRRILDSLDDLVTTSGAALLLVTHDLGVARERAERIVVMRHGRVVEQGSSVTVIEAPRETYTKTLLAAVPTIDGPSLVEHHPASDDVLLTARELAKTYSTRAATGRKQVHHAVRGVSFDLRRGETLALVGESGSGKTTTADLVLGLVRPDSGTVTLDGVDITGFASRASRPLRRRIQPVFQDPSSSLDSRYTVARAIVEPLVIARAGDAGTRRRRAAELADLVSLPDGLLHRRVTELSGGQKQRVAIARALALDPEILVCDEPVSSLDVLVQEQILQLLADLQRRLSVSCLFITHDLGVVQRIAHRVIVLRDGAIEEQGDTADVLRSPSSAYGRELVGAVPSLVSAA